MLYCAHDFCAQFPWYTKYENAIIYLWNCQFAKCYMHYFQHIRVCVKSWYFLLIRVTDRVTDRETGRYRDKDTVRETDREKGGNRDRQADSQAE